MCSLNLFWQHVADRAEGREDGTQTTCEHTDIFQVGKEENLHYMKENRQERKAQKNVLKGGMYNIPYQYGSGSVIRQLFT